MICGWKGRMRAGTLLLILGLLYSTIIVMAEAAPVTQDVETAWAEYKVYIKTTLLILTKAIQYLFLLYTIKFSIFSF